MSSTTLVDIVTTVLYWALVVVGWGFIPVALLWGYKQLFEKNSPWEHLTLLIIGVFGVCSLCTFIAWVSGTLKNIIPYEAFLGLLVCCGWYWKDAYSQLRKRSWLKGGLNVLGGLFLTLVALGAAAMLFMPK